MRTVLVPRFAACVLSAAVLGASCGGDKFSSPGDAGATGGSGGIVSSSGGQTSSGGTRSTGGAPSSGGASTGGVTNVGGSGNSDAGTSDAGDCQELTLLEFQNGGFESGQLTPGWGGAPNPPYYAEVTASAVRSGSSGLELNDTGAGVPGVQQKILVSDEAIGQTVQLTAWVRLVSFPAIRLLIEANNVAGAHLGLQFADTRPDLTGWQQLSTSLLVPPLTDHLMVKVVSAVVDGAGVAHADDVQICVGNLCSETCEGP